ncbi:MAG TPA: hypothetical protein DHW63_08745 [Hyphomonadaceae bacterium]|nr:hypothetical protein [Hyphomonadaceae bacterium]
MLKDSRKIAAILAADVVEYSRLMGSDDAATLAALKVRRAIFDRLVSEFDGQEFGSVGDSLMAQFSSVINAVRCALAIQQAIEAENAPLPNAQRMSLRIGVNLGDVIEENGALFGDGVNVAARLQSLATPGGVLISGAVYEHVRNRVAAQFNDVGSHQVKNITEPVRVFEVAAPMAATLGRRLTAIVNRRVIIATAAYLLGAGLAVSILSRLTAADASPLLMPALITLLAAGFVPAMIAAWKSDRRHRAPPWIGFTATTAATVVCCIVTWAAWDSFFADQARASIRRSVPKPQPVIAVAAFQNQTGDVKLDWLSEGIASLVRDGLAESSHLIVVSPTRWQAVLRDHEGGVGIGADVLSSAARAGIDFVVSGEFMEGPRGLLLTARLSDVDGGVNLAPHRREDLSAQTLLGEASRLVLVIKGGLGVPHTESVAGFSADFAVNNMTAYEAYLNGIGFFLKFDYRSAERAFRKALELAPNFHMARYRLAHVEVASGDTEAGLATLDKIPKDAPLTRRERLYVDGAHAYFERDAGRAQAIYSSMLQEFPFDVEARWLLALSYDLAFEDDAAVAELKRLLEQEPQNDYLWSYLGETYLRLGDYDLARQALDQYLKLKPRDPFGFTTLGQLDQLTGNLNDAADHFVHALELEPGFVPARLALARTQVLRNRWDDAEAQLRRLATDEEAPAGIRIDAAFDLSALLRGQGRFDDSLRPLETLEPLIHKEVVGEAMALAQRGTAHAELGQFVQADKLITLAIERSPGVPTRYLFARASVLLMRGDTAGARAVAAQIRNQPMPQDSPHDAAMVQEDAFRAAAYLEGMADLLVESPLKAREALTRVLAMPGYQYSIYKLGTARALMQERKLPEALEMARAAASERDAGEIRLDLELDRSRALLLEADILAAMGDEAASTARAREFLRRWKAADPGQRDRVRAEHLVVLTVKTRSNGS